MVRLLVRAVGLLIVAASILIGAIPFSSSGGGSSESATIRNYQADFTVGADGTMRALETLTVDFPVSRHGIFRFFDTWDPHHDRNRFEPEQISVTRDGRNEPFSLHREERGRYLTVQIGNADRTITGEHVYRISYRIEGVLTAGTGNTPTEFYWNLIPGGWRMPIQRSELAVHLPAAAHDVQCALGVGTTGGCTATGEGSTDLRVGTGTLLPNTPVTVKTGLDIATPPTNTVPWPDYADAALGRSPLLLGVVVVAALGLGLVGWRISRSTRETDPGFPLMYAPPSGIGPAQATYILTEQVPTRAFVASLMYAAEQGAVKLDQNQGTWTVTAGEDPEVWGRLDPVTQGIGSALGLHQPGAVFSAAPRSVSAGKQLKAALDSFENQTKGWSRVSGLMETSGLGAFGFVVVILAAVGTIGLGAFNPFNMSALALIPGLFGIGVVEVGLAGAGTRRTRTGRDVWSRTGGFHRILSTSSAVNRFDFSARRELYTAYIPWAVAFDCAEEWAKKYRVETGQEPPVPVYFPGYVGVHTARYVDQMVESFDHAVSSAISSYQATQRSSSGGGGFSGGGGGGGGGGGSW